MNPSLRSVGCFGRFNRGLDANMSGGSTDINVLLAKFLGNRGSGELVVKQGLRESIRHCFSAGARNLSASSAGATDPIKRLRT